MTDGASIYILRCADGGYYTGITRKPVEERVSEHAAGLIPGCFTFSRRPVVLTYSEHYARIDEAIAAERRIKGWSRAKKEAYMRGDYDRLSKLAKRQGGGA
jgi:putative endonuclease